jgi:hypothetical protein
MYFAENGQRETSIAFIINYSLRGRYSRCWTSSPPLTLLNQSGLTAQGWDLCE